MFDDLKLGKDVQKFVLVKVRIAYMLQGIQLN